MIVSAQVSFEKNKTKQKRCLLGQLLFQVTNKSPVKQGLSAAASCAKHPHWLLCCVLCICLDRYSEVLQTSYSNSSYVKVGGEKWGHELIWLRWIGKGLCTRKQMLL